MDEKTLRDTLEEKLHITHLDPLLKDEILISLHDDVIKRIQIAILEKLDEEGSEKVFTLLTNDKFDECMDFLEENFPEQEELALAIIDEVVQEFLEASKE